MPLGAIPRTCSVQSNLIVALCEQKTESAIRTERGGALFSMTNSAEAVVPEAIELNEGVIMQLEAPVQGEVPWQTCTRTRSTAELGGHFFHRACAQQSCCLSQ